MSPCVLPSLRLNRLYERVRWVTNDGLVAQQVMDAVEEFIEADARRWGNACPLDGCSDLLEWKNDSGFYCPTHHWLGKSIGTRLLIAFDPITSSPGVAPPATSDDGTRPGATRGEAGFLSVDPSPRDLS
jgi:hypothetical protein